MSTMASQITSLTIVYSTVSSGVDHRKHQSSASLAFVWGIHRTRGPVNSPHKWPVTRKMFPFDDVIMICVNITPSVLIQFLVHSKIYVELYFRNKVCELNFIKLWSQITFFRFDHQRYIISIGNAPFYREISWQSNIMRTEWMITPPVLSTECSQGIW